MFQKINTGLLCVSVILLAIIAWQQRLAQSTNGRFILLGNNEEYGFDTKTGRVCVTWPEIMKDHNPHNTPTCRELR